jgi:thiosulfate/3-mercaptopyruvate sulfurtransferase
MCENQFFVSPAWIHNNIEYFQQCGNELKLVEISSGSESQGGHIPGAIIIDWNSEMKRVKRNQHIHTDSFERVMESYGISEDTTIILYSAEENEFAFHVFWVFWYFNHRSMKLVQGGKKQWEKEHELTTRSPKIRTTKYNAKEDAKPLPYNLVTIEK